jgi:hypothetical protein
MTDAETLEAWLAEADVTGDWHHTIVNGVLVR